MKVPKNVLGRIREEMGESVAQDVCDNWFLLTLDNFTYLQDGDKIGFVNCKSGGVYMGHIFKEFCKGWRKMKIYYKTLRRIQSRIVEICVDGNLFFFKKVVPNDGFSVFYILNGLESGNLKINNEG